MLLISSRPALVDPVFRALSRVSRAKGFPWTRRAISPRRTSIPVASRPRGKAPEPPAPTPDTLAGPGGTRYGAAAPTVQPKGPGNGEPETWLASPPFRNGESHHARRPSLGLRFRGRIRSGDGPQQMAQLRGLTLGEHTSA